MRTSFISRLGFCTLTVMLLAQHTLAVETLSPSEANTLVKEDIAGTQVLGEVCPPLIGNQAKFDANIQKIIQMSLKNYSEPSINLSTLQNDSEYKSLLGEARSAGKQTSKDEQKTVCEDVLNFEE